MRTIDSVISGGVNATETNVETHSLSGQEVRDVYSASSNLCTLVTLEKLAIQIKAATDLLTKQLERLCDLMKELRQTCAKLREETIGVIQGSSKALNQRSDSKI